MVLCCQSKTKLQFWERFTTYGISFEAVGVLSIKDQITILRAIHNGVAHVLKNLYAVNQRPNYNFESDSQPSKAVLPVDSAVNQRPNYNFESDSQRSLSNFSLTFCCQSKTKLQFWERFTTASKFLLTLRLLSIKDQITILRAIHNQQSVTIIAFIAVNQRPNYNFESDSQPFAGSKAAPLGCQSKTKLQFWERFTTACIFHIVCQLLSIKDQITILRAIHNHNLTHVDQELLSIKDQITILRAIHNARMFC